MVSIAFQNKVLSNLIFGLSNMNKAGFKLLLRRDNFVPVGILTVKRPEVDSSRGMTRIWGEGVLIEPDALTKGKFFREPLDRYDKATGNFESVILCENPFGIVITARRSSSIDDEEDNFMWLENPFTISQYRKIKNDNSIKERTISSLRNELESLRKERDFWRDSAESSAAEARDNRERLSILQKKVIMLQSQVNTYKTEAMIAEGLNSQIDAAVRKMVNDARERGIELASTDVERAIGSAEKLRRLREQLAGITPASTVTDDELRKLRSQVNQLHEEIKSISGKKEIKEKEAVAT